MLTPEHEARQTWQEHWRRMPAEERGDARAIFAFISENHQKLPTEWDKLAGDPWTTIHGWLQEADEEDGVSRESS